jgi:hypothetical protein
LGSTTKNTPLTKRNHKKISSPATGELAKITQKKKQQIERERKMLTEKKQRKN